MAKSYTQIQKQIANLQREAEALRKREVAEVVARIRQAIDAYGLTAQDLGLAGGAGAKRGRRAAGVVSQQPMARAPRKNAARKAAGGGNVIPVKYRDGQGNTWTGRGSQPRWLRAELAQGRRIEDFLV